jgi:predicted ATPase
MIKELSFFGFKSLREVGIEVRPVNLLIGPNAAGKSNFIHGLRFLSEALRHDVGTAVARLGGLKGATFWGDDASQFAVEIQYHVPDPSAPHSRSDMSYRLVIGEHEGQAAVLEEKLRLKVERDEPGRAKVWLKAARGRGEAVKDPERLVREPFDTGDPSLLALKALGFLGTYPRVRALRIFVESWQFLSVNLDAARMPQHDARTRSLTSDAANLANVLRTLQGEPTFDSIVEDFHLLLDAMEGVALNVDRGKVQLLIKERPFTDPVELLSASDGTVRLLALVTALHLIPEHGLLCIEEPEHGLHPLVFERLLDVIRQRCPDDGSRQVIVTTHAPDLVDAARPQEVVVVDREPDGGTQLRRLDEAQLKQWLDDFRLGELWRMRQLGGVPR